MLDATYTGLWPIIYRKCRRMLRDEAEAQDVAQSTFERLHRSGMIDRSPEAITAWVYRTSTRLAIDRLRRRDVRRREMHAEDVAPSPEGRVEARALLDRIGRRVPKKEMSVVILHRVDGLTQPEVAEVLGTSERTVRRLLTRFDERGFAV